MFSERKQGLYVSAAMHGLLLLFMVFGLPSWLEPPLPPEPMAISVEILPISTMTNVKTSEKPPAPEPKKEEPKKPEPPKPPTPPVKTQEAPPPPPPPPPPPKEQPVVKKEEKKPEPKKEEPKKPEEKKKEKKQEDDLAAILKSVKKTAQEQKSEDEPKKNEKKEPDASENKSKSDRPFDPSQMVSMSEKDAIRGQFVRCWNMPAGAKDAQNLIVLVEVTVQQDGTVTSAVLSDSNRGRYNSDPFFRAAADSAIRAVNKCSPLKNLPPEKYDGWKRMEVQFDPSQIL